VGANQCNCSIGQPGTQAALLPPAAPMANYVGRSRVYLPYYRYKDPLETYPVSYSTNLTFPERPSPVTLTLANLPLHGPRECAVAAHPIPSHILSQVSVLLGDNLSFPRKGSCKQHEKLGENGCTWKRLPTSRMLYGHDLLDAGWSTEEAWPGAGGTVQHELEATRANAAVFSTALERIEAYVSKRCCGC
jgi:hypothetical protein